MAECEYCSFDGNGSITEYSFDGSVVHGDYGKEIPLGDDFTIDVKELSDDFIRLVKTTNGYFIQSSEGLGFAPINYCPMCGRKLNKFSKEQLQKGDNHDLR